MPSELPKPNLLVGNVVDLRPESARIIDRIRSLEERVAELEEAVVALDPMLNVVLKLMESVQAASQRLLDDRNISKMEK